MDKDRYQNIKDLFLRACEKPQEERAAFLDQSCDDPVLRAELERLLTEDSRDDGSFTARDTAEVTLSGNDSPRTGLESMRIGDYHVVREIGRGAMGTVYEATQTSLGRRVALKVLPNSFAIDARRVQRFQSEARATARIHHPNIIPVYEVGEESGTHYYAMEYIDGASLDFVLAQLKQESPTNNGVVTGGVSDPEYIIRSVERVADLADGLEKAHELALVHRDVKPSNILVNPAGEFVLADFGLVHDEDARITQTGERMGTLGYMAPEQLSFSQVDARADVYSLGATLYEILTLKIPFERPGLPELQKAILFEEPVAPRHLNPSINRDLDTIIQHALEKSPGRRYATAGAFAADLRSFLQHEPIQARPQTTMTRMLRRTWKYRRLLGTATVLLLLFLATSTLIYKHRAEIRQQNEITYENTVLGAIMKLPLGTAEPTEEDEIWPDPVREATQELETASALFPERPEGHYFRGVALHLLGEHKESLAALKTAIDSDADFGPARGLLGVIENPGANLANAASGSTARHDEERNWASIWLQAHDAMLHKQWSAAARAYTLLIESRTGVLDNYLGLTVEAYLSRGRARLHAEEFDQAIEDFGAVKVLLPKMVAPVLLLAKTYLLKGNPELADERLRDLYTRAKFPEEVAFRAAGLFHSLRDYERGRIWAEKMRPGQTRDIRLSDFLRHERKTKEAIEAARKAVLSYPGSSSAHNNLGNCLRRDGRLDEGIEEYRTAIDLDPKYVWAYNNLGTALRKRGDLETAIQTFEKALELRPDFSQVHYNLGNVHRQSGELREAEKAYKEAIRHKPGYAYAWNNLGITLANLGEIREAAEAFRKAAEINSTLVQALNNRGELLLRLNEVPAAIESLSSAIQRKPRYLSPYFLLARAYEQLGDVKRAAATCQRMLLICEEQISEKPDDLVLVQKQVLVLEHMSQLSTALEKPGDARRSLQRAHDVREQIVSRNDVTAEELRDIANAFLTCPIEDLRKPGEALEYARRAVELSESKDPAILGVLAQAHFDLGETQAAIESSEQALALFSEESNAGSAPVRKALEDQLAEFRASLAGGQQQE